jgi:hypothetical protein
MLIGIGIANLYKAICQLGRGRRPRWTRRLANLCTAATQLGHGDTLTWWRRLANFVAAVLSVDNVDVSCGNFSKDYWIFSI